MIDAQQFLQQAIVIARANLPYTFGGQDYTRAARTALQEAHVNLSQADFFAALDALGGDAAVRQAIIDALREEA